MNVVQEVDNVDVGTKIVLHLRPEDAEFSDENTVKDVIKKYSNFVGSDISLNGTKMNQLKPLWLMEPKEVKNNIPSPSWMEWGGQNDFEDLWEI